MAEFEVPVAGNRESHHARRAARVHHPRPARRRRDHRRARRHRLEQLFPASLPRSGRRTHRPDDPVAPPRRSVGDSRRRRGHRRQHAQGRSQGTSHLPPPRTGAPPGTGMEPDCAFYVGGSARAYREALAKGDDDAADAFFEKVPPDLVVEVEITSAARGKIARYADSGRAGAVALPPPRPGRQPGGGLPRPAPADAAPRPLAASSVLAASRPPMCARR